MLISKNSMKKIKDKINLSKKVLEDFSEKEDIIVQNKHCIDFINKINKKISSIENRSKNLNENEKMLFDLFDNYMGTLKTKYLRDEVVSSIKNLIKEVALNDDVSKWLTKL